MQYTHKTVLLNETVDAVDVSEGKIYVDVTFGGGGHSRLLLSQGKDIKLFAFDQDLEAIENGKKKFEGEKRITFIHKNFVHIRQSLNDLGVDKVDGIVADFGVSSHQLDTVERGFSYRYEAPLDMRMDTSSSLTAYDVINSYSQENLKKIIREYGEENWADRIAQVIVDRRVEKPIETTFDLVDIIEKSIPKKMRDKYKHPAKRTFQAIRIEVNNEIGIIQSFIEDAFELLKVGGRIAIITFQSLEDRAVKNAYKEFTTGCICPKEFPVCVCHRKPRGKLVNRKPILPSREEVEANPRARSAKLRVLEKIGEGDGQDS